MNEQRVRIIIVVVAVVLGLAVASIPLFMGVLGKPNSPDTYSTAPAPPNAADPSDGPIEVANEVACPQPPAGATPAADSELANVELDCLTKQGGESGGNLANQLAGKPSVVNVWAWWCAPCREELPLIEQLRQDHPDWNVVGVHLASEGQAGVDFMKELDVTDLPSYQDPNHSFDSATGIPKVVPITLVYRADGTRAAMLAQAFKSQDELEAAVTSALEG